MQKSNKLINDTLAAIACIAAGVLMAALPHFIAWAKTGRPDYVASVDDRYYLALGSQAYFNHPCMVADPVRAVGGASMHRPLPLLPGIWAAKLLGLGPLGVGLMWRVLAGATVGLGWYLLFRLKVTRPMVAASLSLILLCDTGLTHGTPLIRLFNRAVTIASLPSNSLISGGHWIHLEWRSINPATTMVYLIALIWAVLRAREVPTPARIAVAGLTFGLLFHVYFYYWTAAGFALLLALALDAGHRRTYFHVGWIGLLLGLPMVVSDFLLTRGKPSVADMLLRCDRFLPIGRFTELILPVDMLLVLAMGLAWVLIRRRDLIFVWSVGAAGLLWGNQQVISGLQIENYHWSYLWGPAFEFFLVLLAAEEIGDRLKWSPRACAAIGTVALVAYSVGLWIRAVEATRCTDAIANAGVISAYRAEFPSDRSAKFTANAVAAGDSDFINFAAILENLRPLDGWCAYYSPSVTDAELDDRAALNDLLLGVDRSSFEARQRKYYEGLGFGYWHRDRSKIAERVAARLVAYDHVRANLPTALNRFAVRYVGLPAGTKPDYLARGWQLVSDGRTWKVWERTTNSRP